MATNIPSLDTNVLLRLILRDDAVLFESALTLLSRHKQFAVADQAIVEIVYVLGGYYEYSRAEISGIITELINNQDLSFNRLLFARVLKEYAKHPGVSFTDCCLAAYAKLNNQVPLYTFDKKMVRDLPYVELVK